MADDIQLPRITSGIDPEVAASLRAIADGLGRTADASGRAASAAEAQEGAFGRLETRVKAVYGSLHDLYGKLNDTVDSVTRLADEQAQLDATSARLGLDFDRAANAAGRFVDETKAMDLAARLAGEGLNLSQRQLDGISRAAGQFAETHGVSTAEAFDAIGRAIETGSLRAMRQFGPEMVAVAGATHTGQERVEAFVRSAERLPQATDNASSAVERFRDAIDDSKRAVASGFLAQLGEIVAQETAIGSASTSAADRIADLKSGFDTFGRSAALWTTRIVTGLQTIVEGAWVATQALARTRVLGGEGGEVDTSRFRQLTDRLERLSDQTNDNGTVRRPVADAEMDLGAVAAASNARAARRPGNIAATGGAGGAASAALQAVQNQMRDAAQGKAADSAELTARNTQEDALRVRERARVVATETAAAAVTQREVNAAIAREELDERAIADARLAGERVAHAESLAGRLEAVWGRTTTAAQHAADAISGAFQAAGAAIGKHIEAVVMGKESLADALQGMLSDTLAAIAKESAVKAGLHFAAAIGSAAIFDARGVALNLGAAAGYTAVAALAGAGAQATAPSAAAPGGGGAASRPLDAGGRASNDNARGGPVTVVRNSSAPSFGGREGSRAEAGRVMQAEYLEEADRRAAGGRGRD